MVSDALVFGLCALAFMALFVLVLTSVVMVGLTFRSRRTFAGFGADSLTVLGGYLAAMAVLVLHAR